jgi:hypothetical protein
MISSRSTRPPRLAALSTLVVLVFPAGSPSTARAQAAMAAQDGAYQENIERGLQEFDLEHWGEARAFFFEAHALQPSARTLRGLALTSYELRDYVAAVLYGSEALASEARPLTQDMRTEMERILRQARHFVGRLRVRATPATATVWIDGKQPTFQSDGQLLLNPGPHEVVARAPGFDPAKQTVQAEGGDELDVELTQRASGQAASSAPPRLDVSPRSSVGPFVLLGTSAAVAAAGIVLVGVAAADVARVEDAPDGAEWSEYEAANDRAPKLSAAGFAMIGAGALGMAAGIAWKFWPAASDRAGRATLQLAPTGLRLRGRF